MLIGGPEVGRVGREAGFIVRDSLLVLLPGPYVMTAWLFRAPLEGTVVENVFCQGAGGLNVDACRVGFMSETDRASAFPGGKVTSRKVTGGGLGCGYKEHERGGFESEQSTLGRWPTNLVLVHDDGCQALGECVKGCPVVGNASRFYPRFTSMAECLIWLGRLIGAAPHEVEIPQ